MMLIGWTLYPIDKFPDWQDTWQKLNQKNGASALLSLEFVKPLLQCFGHDGLSLAVYHCQQNSVGAMTIIESTGPGQWQTFQPSQAPVGLWLQLPLLESKILTSQLLRQMPGLNWVFGITQQDPKLLTRQASSGRLTSLNYIDTARLSTRGDFDEYLAKRSKNHRQNLRRQRNKLERESIVTRLEVINNVAAVTEAIEQYGELESAGWKSDTNTAININNNQGRFYQQLLTNFMQCTSGLIFKYYYNEKLVAIDLAIRQRETLIILKTTYDESVTNSSPAVLMHQDIFRYLFDDKSIENVEFYGKAMDWHLKWTDDVRTMYHLTYYSWPANMAKKALHITHPVRQFLRR